MIVSFKEVAVALSVIEVFDVYKLVVGKYKCKLSHPLCVGTKQDVGVIIMKSKAPHSTAMLAHIVHRT